MKIIVRIIVFSSLLLEFFCSASPADDSNNVLDKKDTVIYFSSHIRLIGHRSEGSGWTSFKPIEIFLDKNQIYRDTINEYWLTGYTSKQYPRLLNCLNGNVQLLIEVDERPFINDLQLFSIFKEGQIKMEKVPIFDWDPKDINHDGKLDVMGVLIDGETIAQGDTAFYNPTLVYELSTRCLKLDSSATIKMNEEIWGKFHGYHYNDSLLLHYNR